MPLDRIGVGIFRAQVGVVMQEYHLLTGSIAENITFFDSQIDVAWLPQCAAIACIDAEIMAMPMNYNTLVGDLGTGLSGGQRQRLLLARALYRRPKILFMDEGTSHLDLAKEREVNAALRRLQITRVIIAHALKRSPLPSGCCGSKAPRALQRNSRTAAAGRRHS